MVSHSAPSSPWLPLAPAPGRGPRCCRVLRTACRSERLAQSCRRSPASSRASPAMNLLDYRRVHLRHFCRRDRESEFRARMRFLMASSSIPAGAFASFLSPMVGTAFQNAASRSSSSHGASNPRIREDADYFQPGPRSVGTGRITRNVLMLWGDHWQQPCLELLGAPRSSLQPPAALQLENGQPRRVPEYIESDIRWPRRGRRVLCPLPAVLIVFRKAESSDESQEREDG